MKSAPNFFKRIKLKRLIEIFILTAILTSYISASKYSATANASSEAKIAMPVLSSKVISLENVYPDMASKEYPLEIYGSDETYNNQVTLEYTIKITNEGNIPLKIELYKTDKINDEIIETKVKETDKITMPAKNETHTYNLKISWDSTLQEPKYNNYIFNGETNYIKIDIDGNQVD